MNGYCIGDLVRYSIAFSFLTLRSGNEPSGIIIEAKGSKWYRVQWDDEFVFIEHIGDLKLVSRSR
jgi:streptogramin lyase